MKEIVNRLHESRQIELAKSILESAGYVVSKKLKEGNLPTPELKSYYVVYSGAKSDGESWGGKTLEAEYKAYTRGEVEKMFLKEHPDVDEYNIVSPSGKLENYYVSFLSTKDSSSADLSSDLESMLDETSSKGQFKLYRSVEKKGDVYTVSFACYPSDKEYVESTIKKCGFFDSWRDNRDILTFLKRK